MGKQAALDNISNMLIELGVNPGQMNEIDDNLFGYHMGYEWCMDIAKKEVERIETQNDH